MISSQYDDELIGHVRIIAVNHFALAILVLHRFLIDLIDIENRSSIAK
jgi:hypothetical protein